MYTGGIRGDMISISTSSYVGDVLEVVPWAVLCVFVGACLIVAPVPMFYVSSASGFVMPSIVIVLLSNVYLYFIC